MNNILILEKYYASIENWYQDSNCGSFDLSMQIMKDNLESVLTRLQMGYVDSDLISDLILLKEDIEDDNIEVLNAIDSIINGYF